MRTFLSRLIATLRAKVRFRWRFTVTFVRAAARAFACAIRALRVLAASVRLVRLVFSRTIALSRLSAVLLRADVLAVAARSVVRALRIFSASIRLPRIVLVRVNE
jgi:hypothetical protein